MAVVAQAATTSLVSAQTSQYAVDALTHLAETLTGSVTAFRCT